MHLQEVPALSILWRPSRSYNALSKAAILLRPAGISWRSAPKAYPTSPKRLAETELELVEQTTPNTWQRMQLCDGVPIKANEATCKHAVAMFASCLATT